MLYLGDNPIAGLTKPLAVRNVGEIVTSSLPLTDAGLHLLDGSLLQGSGVYSGFVNYIANLYNIQETEWTQPILTSNGILGGDTFAVYASNNYDATTYPLYLSFDGNSSTIWYNSTAPVDVVIYNPNPLKITNIQCQNRINADNYTFTAGTVYGSNDNINYTQIGTFTNNVTTTGGTYNIDLSSNTNFYYYYKITFTSATQNGTGANFTITATQQSTPNYFCNESQWQKMVYTYGSCGKFVYDSTNNTVRLPKVSDILQGTTDVNALGSLMKAGLPNITGGVGFGDRYNGTAIVGAVSGSFAQGASATRPYAPATSTGASIWSFNFNASRSSSIYGNSSTVQPQTVKVLYYIVVATSVKTNIEVDIDQVATDLASVNTSLTNKASIDLDNVTDEAKVLMSSMGMPSNKYASLTLGASGTRYTAPTDGWFVLRYKITTSGGWATLGLGSMTIGGVGNYWTGTQNSLLLPVKKNDIITVNYDGTTNAYFRFVYAQGSESEAS